MLNYKAQVPRVSPTFVRRTLSFKDGTADEDDMRGIRLCAGVAQLVEQLTCNQQVDGPNPPASSIRGKHGASRRFGAGVRFTDTEGDQCPRGLV